MSEWRSWRGTPPQAGTETTSNGFLEWRSALVDSFISADVSCIVDARRQAASSHVQKNTYVKWNEPAAQISWRASR